VDTDVVVDHIRGHRRISTTDLQLAYSVVTRAELFSGANAHDRIRDLLDAMDEIPVDRAIAESAGIIRHGHRIDLPDALIAATAMILGVPLMTRNRRDFEGIKGLKLN